MFCSCIFSNREGNPLFAFFFITVCKSACDISHVALTYNWTFSPWYKDFGSILPSRTGPYTQKHKHTHLALSGKGRHCMFCRQPGQNTLISYALTHNHLETNTNIKWHTHTHTHTFKHTHCACTPVDTAVSLATGLAWRRACHVTGAGCVSCFWRAPGGKIDWPLIWLLRAGEERIRAPLHCLQKRRSPGGYLHSTPLAHTLGPLHQLEKVSLGAWRKKKDLVPMGFHLFSKHSTNIPHTLYVENKLPGLHRPNPTWPRVILFIQQVPGPGPPPIPVYKASKELRILLTPLPPYCLHVPWLRSQFGRRVRLKLQLTSVTPTPQGPLSPSPTLTESLPRSPNEPLRTTTL